VIELSNSTLPLPKEIIDSLFHASGQTTKEGDHQGLGTYIISKIVKAYHGKLEYTYLNHTLTIKIKLPIITKNQD
jgi:LytT family two-component system sensor histidine kinase NatK